MQTQAGFFQYLLYFFLSVKCKKPRSLTCQPPDKAVRCFCYVTFEGVVGVFAMIASCIITFFRVGVATQASGLGYSELEI